MRRILSLLAPLLMLFLSVQLPAQELIKFKDLPEEIKREVKRSEYRKAVKEAQQAADENLIYIPGLERIIHDQSPVILSRDASGLNVNSWGRDVMLPSSVRARVIQECGTFPVILITVDSGVDSEHVELAGEYWLPASNYSGDPEKHWHGTHVAGIIFQMVGEVAKARGNIKFKDAQILRSSGSGSFANATNMVKSESALFLNDLKNGTGVGFNNSWGYTGSPIPSFEQALKESKDQGFHWFASAGNSGRETESYPASSEELSAVASLNQSIRRSSFSTIGDFVDIAAPGSNINSTLPGDEQGSASGTSMASPFITGLYGLAWGKYGTKLAGDNAHTYLNYICTDISPEGLDKETGHGIPYVIKMLDTDPCTVPGVDCSGEDPDDEPDDPVDDEPQDPVLFSAVTFRSDRGHIMRYRVEGQNAWSILYVSDIEVTAEGNGSAESLYDKISLFVNKYFNNRGIVLAEDMSYVDATWWTGQFLEYIARNEGLSIQVSFVEAQDEQGRQSKATGFDRASKNASDVQIVPLDFVESPDDFFDPEAPRWWFVKAEWSVDNTVGGGATPKVKFEDSVGLYYTYVRSVKRPTTDQINKTPPFVGAKVRRLLSVVAR